MQLVQLATCSLNQHAMDFAGNMERLKTAMDRARAAGATYLLTPELSITGYGCEDHFLEQDTYDHAMACLAQLVAHTHGLLVEFGMPVMHRGVRYNARVFVRDGEILLVRPKLALANDRNYREERWFTAWGRGRRDVVEQFVLPACVRKATGQIRVPLCVGVIESWDAALASEVCEELFAGASTHTDLALDGVDIITNGSGSHHELRKLHVRVQLMQAATAHMGGVYVYANQKGCDGGRLYYDGCAMIMVNGEVVAQGSQFSVAEVEVVTAAVDLDAVRSLRGAVSSTASQCANRTLSFPRIPLEAAMVCDDPRLSVTPVRAVTYHTAAEEIALGPALWLWDYLRRAGLRGFFLPLSGGVDSSATATIVGSMCQLVAASAQEGNPTTIADLRRVLALPADAPDWIPESPQALANRIFHTCYMGTENSSAETRARARTLAETIGAYHLDVDIDSIVSSFLSVFTGLTGKTPQFSVFGGTRTENLALQNVQARSRMVLAYLLGQLLPWVRGTWGGLLVLGSANVDEALRGYYTKYDCSSADLNPIGAISKSDLRMFMSWAASEDGLGYACLSDVVAAPPTAELEPITDTHTQVDEVDMGMTYDELSAYGTLRKIERCGPVSMFLRLSRGEWSHLAPSVVAEKVKFFHTCYGRMRHKMTTLTPSYHALGYSPDDNRHDLRQFLYPSWGFQFAEIDRLVESTDDGAVTTTTTTSAVVTE